jgi:hypothetical protein
LLLAEAKGDIISHAHGVEERSFLKDKSDAAAEIEKVLLPHFADVVAHHPDAARVRPQQPGGQLEDKRLSGTAFAQQDFCLTRRNLKADPAKDIAFAEAQAHFSERDEWLARNRFVHFGTEPGGWDAENSMQEL